MELVIKHHPPRGVRAIPNNASQIPSMLHGHVDPLLCLEWPYTKSSSRLAYGVTGYLGKKWRVHRLAYTLVHGEIPAEMHVLHKCDNPSCFNPDHLFLGTNADNIKDRNQKGRTHKGSPTYTKLNAEKVLGIKEKQRLGRTNVAIAAEYGVHHSLIARIRHGRAWGHVQAT